jgi:GNAT superfamily N-acetyltransferase
MGRDAMLDWATSLHDNGQRDLVAIRIDPASDVVDAMKPDTKGYSLHPCSFFLARKRVAPRFLSHDPEGTAAIAARLRELREREEAEWRRWHDDDGTLRERPRPGSTNRLVYRQKTSDHEVTGFVYDDPVNAFNHIAFPFFDQDIWCFLDVDEDHPHADEVADQVVADAWRERYGLRPGDRVFAWDALYVQGDRRGQGLGRAIVTRIEDMFRKDGIRAVILQAGQLDPGLMESSKGFWTKMGYRVWPGDYRSYDDRIMVKVLS